MRCNVSVKAMPSTWPHGHELSLSRKRDAGTMFFLLKLPMALQKSLKALLSNPHAFPMI